MSNTLHPLDGIVISKKWLVGEISRLKQCKDPWALADRRSKIQALEAVIKNSQPLKPVLEVAWDNGRAIGSILSHEKSSERFKDTFLNNPIEMK